ncbi:MAG: glutamate mutase L [Ktedonobacteraceae bacterium]
MEMYTQPHPEEGQGQDIQGVSIQNQNMASANSLLVADCGTVFTKVSLFGLVEGQYRLMARGEAPSTVLPPQEDITYGIMQAINVIEQITGHQFFSQGQLITPEEENGDGVDAFIATISAGGPVQLVVLGAVDATLEALAEQAVSGLYAETHAIPSPSFVAATATTPVAVGVASEQPQDVSAWAPERLAMEWERQLGYMREIQPHAALIVGMADSSAGPIPLQEACQLLVNATKEREEQYGARTDGSSAQCAVLYAGAPQYIEAVRRMLYGVADVTRVNSLVSQAQLGSISIAVGALHERNVMQHIPGYSRLQAWSSAEPVATATSLSSLVRFLAQHYAMNVTAVDVGGATTTMMLAGEQGEFVPNVNAGIGVASGMGAVLQQAGTQHIARWLPFTISEDELRQFVLNCMSHPHVLPTSTRELQISHAIAREAMRLTVEMTRKNAVEWPDADLILATGGILAHAPKYGQVALMLLDALQPRGVTSIVLDKTMLISQLGAVATVAPITAVQVNENDAVTHRLGTCVVPFGQLQTGQVAVTVGVEYSSGRQLKVDVIAGTIEVIPLHVNEQALLTLFPAPMVDVGLGPGERARAAEEIDGGLVGLIIDARGHPLVMPTDEAERQARLLQWMQAIGAL